MAGNAFNNIEMGQSVAQNALQFLARFQLIPTPENYGLAYHFASGLNAGLVRDVQDALEVRGKLVPADIETLRKQHFNKEGEVGQIAQVTNGAAQVMSSIMEQIADAVYVSKAFGSRVSTIERKLTAPSPDISALIGELLDTVTETAEKNAALEIKLSSSSTAIGHLQQQITNLTTIATQDALTGLPNRRQFNDELDRLTKQSRASKNPLALLVMDADKFKFINDQYGHPVGDEVLRAISQTCASVLKTYGTVCRFGGEEFIALLPNVTSREIPEIAESVRKAVAARRITIRTKGVMLPSVTISVGWTLYRHGEAAEELLARADASLYRAKSDGRNCVRGDIVAPANRRATKG